MTAFLDIAALSALLLVLSFVPVLGLRAEARITRQIREAEAARAAEAGRARTAARPASGRPAAARPAAARPASARPAAARAPRTAGCTGRTMSPSGV
jgi:hypothetical protein